MQRSGTDAAFRDELETAIRHFVRWLEEHGPASHDPYDLWGTRYGLWARRLYYRRGILGAPFIAPIVVCEYAFPGVRRWLIKPQRYATADAQLVLAYLNLARLEQNASHIESAKEIAEEMVRYSVPGFSGLCWGYPFDWQNNKGMWPKNTPYITCTPYCFEAFLALHQATGASIHLERAESVARFVHRDLRDTPTGPDAAAGSYSPFDDSKVINASAYRAWVMVEAGVRFDRAEYLETAERNIRFILQSQRADGSWLYAEGHAADAFIDHFHTCFVLKNLHKLNRHLKRADISAAISKGWAYYREHLFRPDGDPKSFALEPRLQVARVEMYNFAESITLGALLSDEIPTAFPTACGLARRLIRDFQLPNGCFVTRVFIGGFKHRYPFIRWPQAQLFLALTNLMERLARANGRKPAAT